MSSAFAVDVAEFTSTTKSVPTKLPKNKAVVMNEELVRENYPYEPYYRTVTRETNDANADVLSLEERRKQAKVSLKMIYNQLERNERDEQLDMQRDLELFNQVSKLQNINPLLDDIDVILSRRADAVNRNSQMRYQQWKRQVYDEIDKQIKRELKSMRVEDISRRRRELFENYLQISNQKKVICDVIDASEYNPLKYKSKDISVSSKHIIDPLRKELDDMDADEKAIGSLKLKKAGTTILHTRGSIHLKEWDKVGDRHNRYCKDVKNNKEYTGVISNIHFDHYTNK